MTRGEGTRTAVHDVPLGTLVRAVLKMAGEVPEGCAVLVGETPVPLDTPVDRPLRLTVIRTFSGG